MLEITELILVSNLFKIIYTISNKTVFMKKSISFLVFLIFVQYTANSQARFQLAISGGPTFTKDIQFRNCNGHINSTITSSVSFLYLPDSTFGIELKYSSLNRPTSYLNYNADNTVKVYTTSRVIFERLLTGFNYYLPIKPIQPFIGLLAGASYIETTETYPNSSLYSFNWGFQAGATVNISKSIALRLDGSLIFIPNVSNKSSYFNLSADGSGFPSFILNDPSKANITQTNINLGLLINLNKRKR